MSNHDGRGGDRRWVGIMSVRSCNIEKYFRMRGSNFKYDRKRAVYFQIK